MKRFVERRHHSPVLNLELGRATPQVRSEVRVRHATNEDVGPEREECDELI
jgi:hypothetical protein